MNARRTEFFLGIYPDRQLVTAFGGYQGAHIKGIVVYIRARKLTCRPVYDGFIG